MKVVTKRNLLKSFHILFSSIWLGAVFTMMLLSMVRDVDTATTLTIISLIKYIDIFVAIAALFTISSGLLISWMMNWGFDNVWVKLKIVASVAIVLIGGLSIVKWESLISKLTVAALPSIENIDYLAEVLQFNTAAVILLVGVFFVSVFKPWNRIAKRNMPIAINKNAYQEQKNTICPN